MRKLEFKPYCEDWKQQFESEKKKIENVLGDRILAIHHIGSTSIPGMLAKPTIDLLVEVTSIQSIGEELCVLGYESLGENGIKGRRFFLKSEEGKRTHHVHLFENASDEVERHLAFRDYLIAHKEEAVRYAAVKKESMALGLSVDQYQRKKSSLVEQLTKRALRWVKSRES
ncbi:GrpB family protein [Shouchella miscanthi]|uniref:GrpB family protein n=1 Tax=Shouchella miscanthi TaxID=2598861 RepID=A0ABU6NIR6_9BACI|nr:GrpB family protein [Shouchella miscanthi]